MQKLLFAATRFARDESGGAVVEYALVIALVVIALVLALGSSTAPLAATFTALYLRVATCLAPGATTC